MKVIETFGRDELAIVYLAKMDNGKMIEFVESLQPPVPREEKWVLIVSSLYGCPVNCKMCDASGDYRGKLTASEIFEQVDYLVTNRFPDRKIPIPKFKVQFARMGEPSFNKGVLEVLNRLPQMYNAPGLLPCLSTVAPVGAEGFFEELIGIKNRLYPDGFLQLQFSIHTTDRAKRDFLIPVKKWDFKEISDYGERFYKKGDRKITLNFAVAKGFPVDTKIVAQYFNPDIFLIKITPLNPTYKVEENDLKTLFDSEGETANELVRSFKEQGFEVILSIGELEENKIGSNCGQYIMRYQRARAVSNS
ncbi:MAG: radical SAM protein [Candidatus Cloacimonadota bacterium]|nr:MAG: radical SAM protein [Candidatus Cloacimonadota bacterium]